MSERRRCSHFFLFPFFFFLLVFLRPPGITGLMEGFLVGDGFGAAAVSAVAGASPFAHGLVGNREATKLKSISDSPAASVILRLTIDLSAPPGLAFTRSLAAQVQKVMGFFTS